MLDIVQAIAERIREQAREYAEVQARIGARTLAGFTDPFGILAALSGHPPVARPSVARKLQPPRPKSPRRRPAVAVKRRQGRRPALNVA
jgi:hypothetical protein